MSRKGDIVNTAAQAAKIGSGKDEICKKHIEILKIYLLKTFQVTSFIAPNDWSKKVTSLFELKIVTLWSKWSRRNCG